jgi:DNA-binding transcriptional LysR family regulator
MELRDIQYFAVVAEHRHLGRAAEALGLSTPALSKSLRRLEQSIQAKLVKRTPKGVELTAEGSALLLHVNKLRMSLHDAARAVADLSHGRVGHLRIGANTGLIDELVAAAGTDLFTRAPNVTMTVTTGNNDVLVPGLRTGTLDLILSAIPRVPFDDIVQEHLFDVDRTVYASATHRLAKHKRVSIADLAKERWALQQPNSMVNDEVHRGFAAAGLDPPRVAFFTPSVSLKLRTVASTDLIGVTSKRILRQADPRLNLVPLAIDYFSPPRPVGVGYRKDAYLSPAAQRFIEILLRTAKEMFAEEQGSVKKREFTTVLAK